MFMVDGYRENCLHCLNRIWGSSILGTVFWLELQSVILCLPPSGGFRWLICLTASVLHLYRDLLSCKVLVRTPRRAGNHGFLTKLTGTSYRTMFRIPVRIDIQICIHVRVQTEYLRHWFFFFWWGKVLGDIQGQTYSIFTPKTSELERTLRLSFVSPSF